jgi:hypothetical protein
MKQIWKFEIKEGSIEMPIGARILTIEMQRGHACMWALVDTDSDYESRNFAIVGTGHDFPDADKFNYIGTVQDGILVWHIFELIRE